ncbi:MAG: phage holin family protein [Candidatus Sungbacteria bacterium]|nr:phage holin family protein [Candidatus Sungbacteria bacterium]
MGFILKLAARVLINSAALYIADELLAGFTRTSGWYALLMGAVILALLNTFFKPVLRFLTFPLRWITLGLFNIVIAMIILWTFDFISVQFTINGLTTLFLAALIIMIANSFL